MLAHRAFAQPRAVQHAEVNSPGAAVLMSTLPAPSVAGNVVVVGVFNLPGGSVSSITDTAGTSYVLTASSTGTGGFAGATLALYSGVVPTTVPVANTVNVTGPFPAYFEIVVAEYSGLQSAMVDLVDTSTPASSPPAVIGPSMSASTDDLLFWWLACEGAITQADGGGFTLRNNINGDITADLVVPAVGTYAPVAVGSCNAMVSALVRFPARVDGGMGDAGFPDAGSIDAGSIDAGSIDAGSIDAGSIDAGSTDAGSTDAGSTDAGFADAGITDAGSTDAGLTDGGTASARHYVVGCDCSSIPATGAVIMMLFFSRLRRRR